MNNIFNIKACFEMIVQNDFNSNIITKILNKNKIDFSYDMIYKNAKKYLESPLATPKDKIMYHIAKVTKKGKEKKEIILSKEIYEYITSKVENKNNNFVDLESFIVKTASNHFKISETKVLEYYYQYNLHSKDLTLLFRKTNNDLIYLKKYLFYVYINNCLDKTVFQYMPILKKYCDEYIKFQKRLEKYLIDYIDEKTLFSISKAEKKYMEETVKKHQKDINNPSTMKIKQINEDNENDLKKILKLDSTEQLRYLRRLNENELKKLINEKKMMFLDLNKEDQKKLKDNLIRVLLERKSEKKEKFLTKLNNEKIYITMKSNLEKIMIFLKKDNTKLDESVIKFLKKEDFSMLDLYTISHIPATELYSFMKDVSKYSNQKIFSNYDCNVFKNFLLNDNRIELDNEKKYKISNTEKQLIINFLERKNIPINKKTYNDAIKRYFEGSLLERYTIFSNYEYTKMKKAVSKKVG